MRARRDRCAVLVPLLTLLTLLPLAPTLAAEGPAGPRLKPAPPEACALLDDPAKRPLMDGLLLYLLRACGREHELGTVRQEPAVDLSAEAGTDVPVNDPAVDTTASSHTQSETSLAVNEVTGTICSGYNDSHDYFAGTGGFSGFSRSTDGGATFSDRGSIGSSSGGDPAVVWRKADGHFYYASLTNGPLGLWKSTDDCQTFAWVTQITNGYDDKELMAVDNNDGSPYYGRLYVAWTDFTSTQSIKVTRSTDAGLTWSAGVVLSTASGCQGAWPVVAPDGTVYVGWASGLFTGTMSVDVSRSTDGGATWTAMASPASTKVEPQDTAASSNCGRPSLKGNIRYLPSPQLAVGPDGFLHAVYSYDPDGASTGDTVDVFYRRSTNGGASWLPEVRLNDDSTTTDQFYPTLSVGSSNVVSAAWYDRRHDPANLLVDYYQRFSFDGGATWGASTRLSDVSTPIFLDNALATCYHGDYDTQVQTATHVLVQWSDDRNLQGGHNDPDVFLDTQAVSTDFLVAASPARRSVCAPADAVYDLDVMQFLGFDEPVTLAVTGVPGAATSAFSANPVTPPGASQLTIGNTAALAAGSYGMAVVGTSTPSGFTHTADLVLDLYTAPAGVVALSAPADGATSVPLRPTFTWAAADQAATYDLEVATDAGFAAVVLAAPGLTGTSHTANQDLPSNAVLFWRVRAANVCGTGAHSPVFDFATVALPGDCGMGTVPQLHYDYGFEAGASGWALGSGGSGNTWALSGARVHTGASSYHATDPDSTSDQRLVSPAIVLPAGGGALTLQFWNWQEMESYSTGCWDGGVVEISTNGGGTWTHLPTTVMLTDPYDGQVSGLSGLDGWCGDPQDWLRSVVDLSAYAGQTAQLRFRLGSDGSVDREGWYLDDVTVQSCVSANLPLFADGFEDGTADAWFNVVP